MLARSSLLAAASLATLIVGLSVLSGVLTYSPVPYWDMWDGGLDFMVRAAEGGPLHWWSQHNEHRILLSRLFFFLDGKCCGGANWPLIVTNYLLAAAAALLFVRILRDRLSAGGPARTGELVLGLVLTSWLFLWTQQENFTSAFQSQFFLAQLLPLCAFYCSSRSLDAAASTRYFLAACAFGLASAGAMANGVLALPLLVLYAGITGQSSLRIAVLLALSAATVVLYFHGYQSPAQHGSLWQTALHQPIGMLDYALLYLGSPFYYLFGEGSAATWLAQGAGLVLVVCTGYRAAQAVRRPREAALTLALITFIVYITGSALGTAGGRLIFGTDQAVSSRYTTPALMAWAALAAMHAPALAAALESGKRWALVPFYTLAGLMLVSQLQALQVPDGLLFERRVSALALELQVEDSGQLARVYPNASVALAVAAKASDRRLSIFGQYPLAGLRDLIDTPVAQADLPPCLGKLDALWVGRSHPRFVRVSGWMVDEGKGLAPEAIRLISTGGRLVGYALTGGQREDVPASVSRDGTRAGYRGYLLADEAQGPLELRGEHPACRMAASAVVLP
jgi:hypothetical protein